MRILRGAWRYITSHEGSFWLLGALLALTVVWVIPFQLTGQSESTVKTIATTWWPFVCVYSLIALATVVCTYRRSMRDVRRIRRGPSLPEAPAPEAVRIDDVSVEEIKGALVAKGLRVHESDTGIVATRARWAPIGGSVFHLGILVFVVGLVVHGLTSQVAFFRVVEGQDMYGPFETVVESDDVAIGEALRGYSLASVTPEYYKDYLLFTRLDVELASLDGSKREMSLSSPLWVDPLTNLSIQDYGFVPLMHIEDPESGMSQDLAVAMDVFPPGSEDYVVLEDVGIRVVARVFPEYGVVHGRDVSLSYNEIDPKVLISIEQIGGREVELIGRGLVAPGETVTAEDISVTLDGLARSGTFRLKRSYGVPVIVLGALLLVSGLALRVLVRRLDIRVWPVKGGVAIDAFMDMSGRADGRRTAMKLIEKGWQP